ncbi:MAG: hypothetical protein U9O50_07075 [Acidobacteriota bacterium]|nr:hypothetical protein [Acidobacteriota bacterium]
MRNTATVPLHPKPIVEGGRVLARMDGNRRCDRLTVAGIEMLPTFFTFFLALDILYESFKIFII